MCVSITITLNITNQTFLQRKDSKRRILHQVYRMQIMQQFFYYHLTNNNASISSRKTNLIIFSFVFFEVSTSCLTSSQKNKPFTLDQSGSCSDSQYPGYPNDLLTDIACTTLSGIPGAFPSTFPLPWLSPMIAAKDLLY